MQQYIYGNINKAGYTFISSAPDFFKDAKRQNNLNPLIKYDMACVHGELEEGQHQSCWMIFTDLNIAGEAERLYFQVSGSDPFRSGFYVQGYMSDPEEEDLCGPGLLRMLKTRFSTYEQSMAAATAGALKPVSRDMLPIQADMQPARIHRELAANILLALLDGDRVIVRLPSVGAEAMKQSREFLLSIYQRLPYEQRRLNGFFTGASASRINDLQTPLPGSIKLILMDADADAAGLEGGWSSKFIDLTVPGTDARPMRREKAGKQLYYVPLIDFLLDSSLEKLDEFFRFCQNYLKAEGGSDPDIKKYLLLLEIFQIGQTEATDEQIVIWADSIFSKSWTAESKEQVYDRIADSLTPERLLQHLKRVNTGFGNLETLGVITVDRSKSREEVRDENCAYTLRMTEALLQRYPAGTEAWLREALYKHFISLAVQAHPCLPEERPTAEVIRGYDRMALHPDFENTTPMVKKLREQVYQTLRERDAAIRKEYQEEYAGQYRAGTETIGQYQLVSATGLQTPHALYQSLQRHYLYGELLNGRDHPTWNEQIARKITDVCANVSPRDIESCRGLLEWYAQSKSVFEDNLGRFDEAQEAVITAARQKWTSITELYDKVCTSPEELLRMFEAVDAATAAEPLAGVLKERLKDSLLCSGVKAEQVFACLDQLLQHCRKADEQKLCRQVLEAVPELLTIPEDMEPVQILERLNNIQLLAQSRLVSDIVTFPAWGQSMTAKQLGKGIRTLQTFTGKAAVPELNNPKARSWAVKMLQDNTELMLFMALHDSEYRSRLVPLLATRHTAATQDNIRALYVAGCTKEELRRGAGTKTVQPWKEAVDALFEKWVWLPEFVPVPIRQYDKVEDGMTWAMVAVTSLTGLLPPGLLLLTGDRIMSHWLGTAIVLLVLALGCLISGFVAAAPKQRRLLRWLSIVLLPGMIASIVMMVLTLL